MNKYLINERVREIRKELGLTQVEFSEKLDIKRCNLGAYEEKRAEVPLQLIPKIIKIGHIPKKDLFKFLFDKDYEFYNI